MCIRDSGFISAVGHNRFTDADWHLTSGNIQAEKKPIVPMQTGGVNISYFSSNWTDLRMACNQSTGELSEQAYGVLTGFTTANGNYKLLGAAGNGTAYNANPSTNSAGNSTIWMDNETDSQNSGHYLCDTANSGPGTTQFSMCYTNFLNNNNDQDMGDTIVGIAFGHSFGNDSWSSGFSGECGNMGSGYLGDAGTFSIWVR